MSLESKSRYKGYNEIGKKAAIKYMSENCEKLSLTLKKGTKERWKDYADKHGESVTAMITRLIEEDMILNDKGE